MRCLRFATADDLHGDAVFCQREVDVVRAARGLLRELDPCGIEKFSEFSFPFTDVKLTGESEFAHLAFVPCYCACVLCRRYEHSRFAPRAERWSYGTT